MATKTLFTFVGKVKDLKPAVEAALHQHIREMDEQAAEDKALYEAEFPEVLSYSDDRCDLTGTGYCVTRGMECNSCVLYEAVGKQ